MKTLRIAKVMLGMLFLIGFYANAQSPLVVHTKAMSGKKLALNVTHASGKVLNVTMKTESGEILVEDKKPSKESTYSCIYNLSQLADGGYMLKVESDEKIYNASFDLYDDTCTIWKKDELYKPVFESENNDISVSFNNSGNEKVYVFFRNSLGNFFKDELQPIRFLKRKYNIEKLEPGDYQLVLLAGEREYSYPFEVR
jgi:hypothetical protein